MTHRYLANNCPEKKTGRLSVRVDEATKEMLEHAAALEGLTVSAFILRQASRMAHKVIEEHEHWRLSEQDRNLFLELLDNPPGTQQCPTPCGTTSQRSGA